MKKIFLLLCTLSLVLYTNAQHRCSHIEYLNYLYGKNPKLKDAHQRMNKAVNTRMSMRSSFKTSQISSAEETYLIPVVVHVIHNVQSGEITGTNISDEQIYSQIRILNEDYGRTNPDRTTTPLVFLPVAADTKIQFVLAKRDENGNSTSGINRVYTTKSSFAFEDEERLKSLAFWPNDKYLNIWVCNLGSNILGYAQFPNNTNLPGLSPNMGLDKTDGVVIDYQYFGDIGTATFPYNLGRTATHEVGHWLGLIHIWGDEFCGDDFVSDTPEQEDPTEGASCITKFSSCTGPSSLDMSDNYLDYSADACMNMFTNEQKNRMRSVMTISPTRLALNSSYGSCEGTDKEKLPIGADFEDNQYLAEFWSIQNDDATSQYTKQWIRTNVGAYGKSNGSLMIENDSVYTFATPQYKDIFISPYVDLSSAEIPIFNFDLAYGLNETSSSTDSLLIGYTDGCRGEFVVLKTLYGSSLLTTSRRMNDFVPTEEEWKNIDIDISSLRGKKFIKFKIIVYSKGINRLYIDNVNLYKGSSQLELTTYPVPSNEEVTFDVTFIGYKDFVVELYNMVGRQVMKFERFNINRFNETVSLKDLENGVYIVRITSGTERVTKRVVKF